MGELVSLDDRRADTELRAKVPARYRGYLCGERWLERLAAKVRHDLSSELTPEQQLAVANLVAHFLEHSGR